jgi:hypothetical protein
MLLELILHWVITAVLVVGPMLVVLLVLDWVVARIWPRWGK